MPFPGARGTFGAHRFLPEVAQLSYVFRFGRPDPQGREITKYWFSRPFWPRTALGTNSGRKTEKHNIPGSTGVCVTKKIETQPLQLGPKTQS